MADLHVLDGKVMGAVPSKPITKSNIAKFILDSEAQGMNNQQFDIVTGQWHVEDSALYTPSGNRLVILTAGVYEINMQFHGLVNPGSYCEEMIFSGALSGGVVHAQVLGLGSGSAIQGFGSSSVVVYIPANTVIELQAYTSDLNNFIYGSRMSNQNFVIVTKLG